MTDQTSAPTATVTNSKPWYTSKTIWGTVVSVLSMGAAVALPHANITSADQQELVNDLAALGTMIGGLIAMYGRVTATKTIGKKQ